MKPKAELLTEAKEACTMLHNPYEYNAWIDGYITAAERYAQELEQVRTDLELAQEIMHG